MRNRKNNKRALIVSALSLLLCVSMLVGSTMAWFTDNASTAVNKIQAGTLDIDLLDKDGNSLDGKTIGFADMDTNSLWEPGCRYTLQEIKLVNKGNLHAKYRLSINAVIGDVDLSKVIDVYEGETKLNTLDQFLNQTEGFKEGTIGPGETLSFGTLKLVMQETAGNEYQGKSIENIAITVQATQDTVESDSFGSDYDAGADFAPVSNWDTTPPEEWDGEVSDEAPTPDPEDPYTINIETAGQLAAFVNAVNGGNAYEGYTVNLQENIDLNDHELPAMSSFAGTFDGQHHTISGMTNNLFGTVTGTVKDLRVADVKILNTARNGANAFIGTLAEGGMVDGCAVSNVNITWADTVTDATDCWGGVISRVNAGVTVQNCEFTNISVSSSGKMKRTGGVFGEVSGDILNCTVNGVTFKTTNHTQQSGGVIGDVYYGAKVSDCTFNNVTLDTYRALSSSTGGIIGKAGIAGGTAANMTLKNISVNGLVVKAGNTVDANNKGVNNVGGFIGQVDHRTNAACLIIDNCDITGLDMTLASLKLGEDPSGGFIASLNGNADITNCSVSGKIDGTNEPMGIGGFLGTVGGYGGNNYDVNITDCSANVAITGNANIYVGGFVAYAGSRGQSITLNLRFTNCAATGSFYGQLETDTNEVSTFSGCTVDGAAFNG